MAAMEEAGALVVGLDRKFNSSDNHADPCRRIQRDVVTRATKQASAEAGSFDMLVNAAGIYDESTLRELASADYQRIFSVNVRGHDPRNQGGPLAT